MALSRHSRSHGHNSEGPGEPARGLRWSPFQPALTLRGEISEPDVAVAAAVCDVDRPAGTARAARPARREGLVPTRLHRLADRIDAGRQTGEPVVARGIGGRRCVDRAVELDAPARETGPRRRINEHLAVD